MLKEFCFRLIQHCFSLFVFDFPILSEFKRLCLKNFIKIGNKSYIAYSTFLVSPHTQKYAYIEIGNNVGIEHRCDIDYSGGLIVKDNVWISEGVIISTHTHKITNRLLKKTQGIEYSQLIVESDAWICAGSIILPSVNRIGNGAIVGAGAVVTKDVDDFSVVVGNPAKHIRFR